MRNATVQRTYFPIRLRRQASPDAHAVLTGHPRIRRASVLIEAVVGCIVLGVAISMLLPAMAAVRSQRHALRFESLAMLELNNLDRSIPSSVDPSHLPELSEWFRRRYGKAELKTELLQEPADATLPRALRMTIHQPSVEFMPEQRTTIVIWRQLQETAP